MDRQTVDAMLRSTKTIAVVGLSGTPGRPSANVAAYLQAQGFRIVPVNPGIAQALGEKAYPTLEAAQAALHAEGSQIDLVDVFRAASYVPEIVKDVIRLQIPALWLQLGVVHEEAAGWARQAGVRTMMDECLMVEHAAWKRSMA